MELVDYCDELRECSRNSVIFDRLVYTQSFFYILNVSSESRRCVAWSEKVCSINTQEFVNEEEGLDMSERQTDRWRDRRPDGQTDRQWDGHEGLDMSERQTDRRPDRQTVGRTRRTGHGRREVGLPDDTST